MTKTTPVEAARWDVDLKVSSPWEKPIVEIILEKADRYSNKYTVIIAPDRDRS